MTLEAAHAETLRILGDPAVDGDPSAAAPLTEHPRRECRDRHEAFRFLMQ